MTGKKFSVFVVLIFILFALISVSGCGGSGGGVSYINNNPGKDEPESKGESFTVTFDSNGGSPVESITVSADSTIEEPYAPVKTASIFSGWFRDNNRFKEVFVFGEDGERISKDLTLYAQWADDDPEQNAVDFAAALVGIIYQDGDSPGYVTRKLTLTNESLGANVSWSSSSGAVSATGEVTRPSGSNADVVLTATVRSGDKSAAKEFRLTVIKARTRSIADMKADTDENPFTPVNGDLILLMNESNDAFNIVYDDNDEQIRHIDGKFSELEITNADDALDAVYGIHEALGINDPYSETIPLNVAKDEYGAQYSFKQVYAAYGRGESYDVYGRTLMVSANASGDSDFLSSTFIATESLDTAFASGVYFIYSNEDAERSAIDGYPGVTGLEVDSSQTKKIIYTLGEYEKNPVPAFLVKVSGTDINQTLIISAVDLSVIRTLDNVCTWVTYNYGYDELGEYKRFPVTVGWSLQKSMRDRGTDGLPEVVIYSGSKSDTNIPKVPYFVSTSNSWNDEHQVSAYTNMRTVIRWWKDTFNRNSLDDKGMTINLVTHVSRLNDNACWNSATETISVGDIGDTSEYNLTRAMGLDTLTHETGHAVLHYVTGGIPYQNATGAIDDGYADIFGCLRDQDWRHGWRADNDGDPETGITYFIDKTACLRDAREDISVKSLSESARSSYGLSGIETMAELYDRYKKVPPTHYGNDGNGCHTYCRLVTHAAYLMHQDGASDIGRSSTQALTWYELGRVWYKSLSMGLDSTSNFHTVRRNVIRAARQFRLPEMKIITIKKAFDKVEISDAKGTLKGSIEDWDNGEMITGGATITLRGSSGLVEEKAAMDSKGNFELKADAGNYTLLVSPTYGSYRPYQTRIHIPADRTVNTEVELVKTGTGTLDVYLYDTNSHAVNGAAVSITNDYTLVSRSPSSWTSTGKYTFQNVNSGYYTVYVSKSGYDDHSFKVIVPPGKGTTRKIFMTLYAATNARYMVCLESSKTFLEPHMLMKYSNGTMQDVNKNDVHTFAPSGRESGRYSSQNSGKIKYTLYTNFVSTEYKYYVAWGGSEKADWNGARPGVWLYYKGSLLKKYSPPKEAPNGSFWEVFGISKKGSRYTVNEIREDEPTIE